MGRKEIGFDAVDAHPIALQDAAAKSLKFVPYSPFIFTTPPAKGTSYILINVCMKGSSFQKLYIADPHDEPTADSLTEEAVSVVEVGPFWNSVRSCQGETNLKLE